MRYEVDFKPRALKDLEALPPHEQARILEKIEAMRDDLTGNVKRLTNFSPEFRLRVGDYRVLFETEIGAETHGGEPHAIIIYRVLHRKDAYRG